VSFPGLPLVIAGHNEQLAWGFTNGFPDVQDLYMEHLRQTPEGQTEYEFRGEWLKADVKREEIKVKGTDPVVENVIVTHHGPIINSLIEGEGFAEAYKALSRVSRIQSVMTLSWDVLATLTPVDYLAFRHVLGTSSGFQSAQFRELEYRLGIKDAAFLQHYPAGSPQRDRLESALGGTSLRDAAANALQRAGFDVGDRSVEALAAAWLAVYRDADRWFELYQLAEKLVDIDDALAMWRHKHVLTVERIIGSKRGTGGSSGAAYLRSTLDKRVFPELWALRTEL
jgi:tryptophan 2,3-dioxygenase